MGISEEELQHIRWNYEQLCNIVRLESNVGIDFKQKLKSVENIIKRELPELLRKAAPPNVYELTENFNAEYEKFKDFIIYDSLIGKNVIGLGGGFSSGKSSFLNSLMGGGEILPENINPSTSVPSYIVYGEQNVVKAINIFDACVELELAAINEISHGFGSVGEDGEEVTESVQLGHILKNLFLETNLQKYRNLVFLDTPGYSKPDTDGYSAKTDESIARQQLNTVDYILWFLPVSEAGSFTESDLNFIKSLNQETPITVICSKANRRTEEQRKDIENKIREQVLINNLNVNDVLFFDTESPDELDSAKIYKMFENLNETKYDNEVFAKSFKRLFWECREYYRKQKEKASIEISNLTKAILLLEDTQDVSIYIERVKANSEKERSDMEKAEKEMLNMQTVFFKEIKAVADRVGIYMPEPNDIDVLGDKVTNPLTVIQEYNKKNKKTVQKDAVEKIADMFRGVQPVFESEPGGSKYKEEVYSILTDIGFPKGDEIVFGNDINYKELISAVEVPKKEQIAFGKIDNKNKK